MKDCAPVLMGWHCRERTLDLLQVSVQVAAPLHERLITSLDGVPPDYREGLLSSLDGFVSHKIREVSQMMLFFLQS